MSAKQRKLLWPSFLALAVILAGLYLVPARTRTEPESAAQPAAITPNPPDENSAGAEADPDEYVRRGRLRSPLQAILGVLGDRLEKPGKERLALSGTLKVADSGAVPVQVVQEFPDHLRVVIQNDGGGRVLTFDGRQVGDGSGHALERADKELIETLVNDSVEHFFVAQLQGRSIRFLGPRFRIEDGSGESSGPVYDIYEVNDQVSIGGSVRQQRRHYYFNSDSLLLERVRFQVERDGTQVDVEILLNGWQKTQEQQTPRSVVRTENGVPVLTLTFTSAEFGARAADGLFGNQQ